MTTLWGFKKTGTRRMTKFAMYVQLRGITLKELGKLSGVNRSYLYRMSYCSKGNIHIPPTFNSKFFFNLKKIMDVLQCEMKDII